MLAQEMTTQVNQQVVAPANLNRTVAAIRIWNFIWNNPSEFNVSMVGKDPWDFIDEIQKILKIMGITPMESTDLTTYQYKGVDRTWCKQWKKDRGLDLGQLDWDEFLTAFLDNFFPFEFREYKVKEFINIKQGNMTIKEYCLRFTQLLGMFYNSV